MLLVFMARWSEWLVLGIGFLLIAVFSFISQNISNFLGIPGEWVQYLVFGKFFGAICFILAIMCFINLIITAKSKK